MYSLPSGTQAGQHWPGKLCCSSPGLHRTFVQVTLEQVTLPSLQKQSTQASGLQSVLCCNKNKMQKQHMTNQLNDTVSLDYFTLCLLNTLAQGYV